MKKTLVLVVMLSITTWIFGQPRGKRIFIGSIISNDSSFQSSELDDLLPDIRKSNLMIEVRLIKRPSFDVPQAFVLSFDKKWSFKLYTLDLESGKLQYKESISDKGLERKFNILTKNHVFSLPDDSNLGIGKFYFYPELGEIIGDGMTVSDGTQYWLEFKVGSSFRRYRYSNPLSYAQYYDNVREFKEFSTIVMIFEKLEKRMSEK